MGDPAGKATDGLHLLRLAQALLRLSQRLLPTLALDADRQGARDRGQRLRHELGELMAGEHGHDAQDPLLHDQGVTGERHHPLASCPLLVVDLRVAHDVIGEMGTALLGDHADLVLAQRHATV